MATAYEAFQKQYVIRTPKSKKVYEKHDNTYKVGLLVTEHQENPILYI